MSTEHQSKEDDEANRNIAEFLDALEHGECETGEKTLPDKKELAIKQISSNRAPASGTSILQMNPPSVRLSPVQTVPASQIIGPYIDPIVLCMSHATEAILRPDDGFCLVPKSELEHNNRPAIRPVQRVYHLRDLISNPPSVRLSPVHTVPASQIIGPYIDPIVLCMSHATEAILRPDDGFCQVPKSELEHNNRPAIRPVQRVYHLRDLISEDAKMGGTIPETGFLGSRNVEFDGSFSGSEQRDCPLPMNVDSSVLVQEQPQPAEFQRWMDEVTPESATDGSPPSPDMLVPANRVNHSQEPELHCISGFDLNQLPPSSPQTRAILIPIPVPNSLYDPRYEEIGLPTDPILRMFVLSRGFYAP